METYEAQICIEADGELLKVLLPEAETSISEAKIYLSGGRLCLRIRADSISDLRAAINSWLRLIKMCMEIEGVLKNE